VRFLKASEYFMNNKVKIDAGIFRNNPDFKLDIEVNENNIKVELDLIFKSHNKVIKHESLLLITSNKFHIPSLTAEIS
jgi:hypothetical protein